MRNFLIISILLSTLACTPSMDRQEVIAEREKVGEVDSIPTIDLEPDSSEEIIIKISDNSVVVESGNVNTVYNVDVSKIILSRTETGLINYLQVNQDILFKEKESKHVYTYLDAQTIIVQSGNTISGILADHGLTRKELLRCNPFLTRGLQVEDHIKLSCN